MYMWIVKLAFVRPYALPGRTDTCLSVDSRRFSVVRMSASRFADLRGFKQMSPGHRSHRGCGAVIATSKLMFGRGDVCGS